VIGVQALILKRELLITDEYLFNIASIQVTSLAENVPNGR